MTLQRDEWDADERRALADVQGELDRIRARHRNDPPFELLRAAHAEALPDSLQAELTEHLQQNAWSRTLVDDAADDEVSIGADAERRLLARIQRDARRESGASSGARDGSQAATKWWSSWWVPALATAAILVVMVGVLRQAQSDRPATQPSQTTAATPAAPTPAPSFALPLDKPEVKLTAMALVLRSSGRGATFVDEVAPALNAYRAGNYTEADRLFGALEPRYPQSVEVAFYRGVSRLFLNDAAGAVQSLQTARRLDDETFAPEIAWYLAVAHERAGNPARARAELESLCRGKSPFAPRACEAAPKVKPE